MENFKQFTQLTKNTKTVRMIPQGETMRRIKEAGIIKTAEDQAEKMDILKKYISDYHRYVISQVLDPEYLIKYVDPEYFGIMYEAGNEYQTVEKDKKSVYDQTCSMIEKSFKSSTLLKSIKGIDFFKTILPEFYKDNQDVLNLIEYFKNRTSRFGSFLEAKERMYENSGKAGSIINRIMKDNLPKYMNNYTTFARFMDIIRNRKTSYEGVMSDVEEIMNYLSFEEIDITPENYYKYMNQQGIDLYNTLIGGVMMDDGSKIKGINELISVHNQKCTSKEEKVALMTPLFKQISSITTTFSVIDNSPFEEHDEVTATVKKYAKYILENETITKELLNGLMGYNLDGIYIDKKAYGLISNALYNKSYIISTAIEKDYDRQHNDKNKTTKKYKDEKKKALNNIKAYSILQLDDMIGNYFAPESAVSVTGYYSAIDTLFDKLSDDYKTFNEVEGVNYRTNNDARIKIKAVLDDIIAISRLLKTLNPSMFYQDIDVDFYAKLEECLEVFKDSHKLYNKTRNFITQKDFDTDKIQVDFNFNSLMRGWSDIEANGATILLKDGEYFLGIVSTKNKGLFDSVKAKTKDVYQVMNYHNIPSASKYLPANFMAPDKVKSLMKDYPELQDEHDALIPAYMAHKNDQEPYTLEDEKALVKYYHRALNITGKVAKYELSLLEPEDYTGLAYDNHPYVEFVEDVQRQGYGISFYDVDKEFIDKQVKEGNLYLFKIYNRDFSEKSYGKPNLFTLYWKAIFDERNLFNPVFQLLGNGTVTFRAKSINNPFRHKKGTKLSSKTDTAYNKSRTFNYDLIKNKRYTCDHFEGSFTLCINKNGLDIESKAFNKMVYEYIQQEYGNMHIIGLTRGERNLLYYTVIDTKGNVVEHGSLNKIKIENNKGTKTEDYWQKLNDRERDIEHCQRVWTSEYSMKDLKSGYVSQVVPKICELMIKYNATLFMEDLSGDIKIKGKSLEKGVFTDIENAILAKLNLYVNNKDFDSNKLGSVFNGYQLTPVLKKKEDMFSQQGFVFFINTGNTGNMDPSTGFVNKFRFDEKNKSDYIRSIEKFRNFTYKEGLYYLTIDYSSCKDIELNGVKPKWTLNSNGKRYYHYRNRETNNRWKHEVVYLTEAFDKLFEEYAIDTDKNITEQILEIDKKDLYADFFKLIMLMLRMNNTMNTDNFFVSPVTDSIFNTQNIDSDFVASYNIARKGLMAMENIKDHDVEAKKPPKIHFKTTEWMDYVNNNPLTEDMM